jgi:hypothetical protein
MLPPAPCPVSKLPAELLVEIFLDVVSPSIREKSSPPTLYAPHTPSYLSCASPLSLSHVCSTWRAVSLSLPRLWTSLQVVCPNDPKVLPLLSLWLQRSRSHKLKLSLYQLHGYRQACSPVLLGDSARDFELEFEATRQVWQLFLTTVDRWSHVDVNVCMSFQTLLDNIGGGLLQRDWSAPLPLEAIKVAFGPCESGLHGDVGTIPKNHPVFSDESTFFAYLLCCSPHLCTVEWDNRYAPISFKVPAIWPPSLTDITLYGSQDVVSILTGLSTCKSLRRLTIYEQTVFSPHLVNHANHYFNLTPLTPGNTSRKLSTLILPCLEILRLGNFPHPESLFDHLVAPNLHTLIILRGYNGRRGMAWTHQNFLVHIVRNAGKIMLKKIIHFTDRGCYVRYGGGIRSSNRFLIMSVKVGLL